MAEPFAPLPLAAVAPERIDQVSASETLANTGDVYDHSRPTRHRDILPSGVIRHFCRDDERTSGARCLGGESD
jgi:hypothetical protein